MKYRNIFSSVNEMRYITVLFLMVSFVSAAQNFGFNSATGNVKGRNYVGGLTGRISEQEIKMHNSFSRGSVEGVDHVGGVVGQNGGLIENSYATGRITGTSQTGGIAGSGSGSVIQSYWDIQSSGQTESAGGLGRNTDPMTYPYASDTYVGWDFNLIWQADPAPGQNGGYPYLKASRAYRISIQVYPPGSGTVSGEGVYPVNTPAQLKATSGSSFKFQGWYSEGEAVGDVETLLLKVTQNVSLVARFVDKSTGEGKDIARKEFGMDLYPNPARELIRIRPNSPSGKVTSLALMNISGQPVMEIMPDMQPGETITVSLNGLAPGIYIVVARFPEGMASGKVVKF